jgi:hypothetical protein
MATEIKLTECEKVYLELGGTLVSGKYPTKPALMDLVKHWMQNGETAEEIIDRMRGID